MSFELHPLLPNQTVCLTQGGLNKVVHARAQNIYQKAVLFRKIWHSFEGQLKSPCMPWHRALLSDSVVPKREVFYYVTLTVMHSCLLNLRNSLSKNSTNEFTRSANSSILPSMHFPLAQAKAFFVHGLSYHSNVRLITCSCHEEICWDCVLRIKHFFFFFWGRGTANLL